jgi:hypothetical protein
MLPICRVLCWLLVIAWLQNLPHSLPRLLRGIRNNGDVWLSAGSNLRGTPTSNKVTVPFNCKFLIICICKTSQVRTGNKIKCNITTGKIKAKFV